MTVIHYLVGVLISLAVVWLILLLTLLVLRPKSVILREAVHILPDLLRLLRRLASDNHLPHMARARLWLLLIYLALPFDLVPDFIPVIGYADDTIIVVAVLRSVVRKAGLDVVKRHWIGSQDGFAVVVRLCGLESS